MEPPMESVSRRDFLALAALAPLQTSAAASPLLQPAGSGSLFVCMHEASSDRFDFKTAMEGYAKAGIRAVEPALTKVREFAQKESPATARRLLDDLGLRAVSSSNQLGLAEPSDARARSLEDLKWKVELAQTIEPTAWWRRRPEPGPTRRTITSGASTICAKPPRSRSRSV